MTAAEREVIARIVRETCTAQNIPLAVPAEVCRQVAAILRNSTRVPRKAVADVAT